MVAHCAERFAASVAKGDRPIPHIVIQIGSIPQHHPIEALSGGPSESKGRSSQLAVRNPFVRHILWVTRHDPVDRLGWLRADLE